MFVPVCDHHSASLMPTAPARARRWVKMGKATPFWKGGIWCVRLNQEPSARSIQAIAVGIDPGSKKEALVVKSAAHTYLNIQADAVTWVKDAMETRRTMRRARRFQEDPLPPTPCQSAAQPEGDAAFDQSPLAVETASVPVARPALSQC